MTSQKALKLYVYIDGVNDVPFYGVGYCDYVLKNGETYTTSEGFTFNVRQTNEQIEIGSFRYDAKRMGGAPTLTFTLMYETCLDDFWNGNVYALFNRERHFLKQTPTSSKTSDDARYKHEVEMVAERVILDNAYFYDAVSGTPLENDKPVTNDTKFQFYGNIEDFVRRMNASLQYTGLQKRSGDEVVDGYYVVLDEDIINRDERMVSFDGAAFSQALQESYNTFGIPYYFNGKEIHIGFTDNVIDTILEYGVDEALMSVTRNNSNFKVVNRATGKGSTDNIPYFYPNNSPKGEIEFSTPTTNKGVTSEDILIADKEQMTLGGLHPETEYIYKGDGVVDYNVKAEAPTDGISSTFNNGEASIVNVKTSIDDPSLISIEYTFDFNGDGEADVNLDWSLDIPIYQLYSTNESSNYYSRTHLELQVNGISLSSSMGETKPIEVEVKKEKIRYLKYCTVNPNYAETTTEGFKERATGIAFKVPNSLGKIKVTIYARLLTIGVFWQSLTPAIKEPKCSINFTTSVFPHITGGWKANGEGESINMSAYGLRFSKNPVYGDSFSYSIAKYIKTSTNLQPSIYRATDGKERFYNAKNYPFEAIEGYELQYGEYIVDGFVHNDAYKDNNGQYYHFENEYTDVNPKEHAFSVDDLKPTIKEATNNISWVEKDEDGKDVTVFQRIDMFSKFAYDNGDNDETYTDENGDIAFKHPYFFGKLRKLDFNLFEHASEKQAMTFSFTSGHCGACNFEVGVSAEYPYMNPVQIDDNGNLVYDEQGRVLCGLEDFQDQVQPLEEQQDTINNEVWIALKKDEDTYGILMPKAPKYEKDENGKDVLIESSHRPKACSSGHENDGDTFVIIGINLPEEYIYRAEKKLENTIVKYIWENNKEKFNFSVGFSRIFLEENQGFYDQLDENARLNMRYNGKEYLLYVSSYSYQMNEGDILPNITVELDDTLTIAQNALQNAINEVKSDIASAVSAIDVAALGGRYFLRKDVDDVAQGVIDFRKGIVFSNGGDVEVYNDGSAKLTIDYLEVTKKATFTSLEVQDKHHVGGQILITPASMTCADIAEVKDDSGKLIAWRCYMQTKGEGGEEVYNTFAIDDQAICQTFNEWGNKYYWRLVTNIGEDYIDLSVEDCDENSDVPSIGDKIIQLGNRSNGERQAAQVLSSHGENAPSFIMYNGINSFSLEGKEVTGVAWNSKKQEPKMYSYGDFFFGDRDKEKNFISFDNNENEEEKSLRIKANVTIEEGSVMASRLDVGNPIEGDVEAFFNGGDFAVDNEHGKLILAAGIPDGDLEEESKNASTRIYEDGCTFTNKLHLQSGCTIGDNFEVFTEGSQTGMRFVDYDDYDEEIDSYGRVAISNSGFYAARRTINPAMVLIQPNNENSRYSMLVSKGTGGISPVGKGNIALVLGAKDGYAVYCQEGMFAGLRPTTRVISTTGSTASRNLLNELDFSVLVNLTSGTCYLELPKNPLDGQEYHIESRGANLNIIASQSVFSHYSGTTTSAGTPLTQASRALLRFKFYKDANLWTIAWMNRNA